MRFALGISYDGSCYHGFQHQNGLITIESELRNALEHIADHAIEEFAVAGRTDAGVHAIEQVVHFDTHAVRPEHGWVMGLNTQLPHDISVRWIRPVSDDFHARFSAIKRSYQYIIYNSPYRLALWHKRATRYFKPLDKDLMQVAANILLGEHDFSSFRAASCQSLSTKRTMYEINIQQENEFFTVDICANAFLHHMVRNIVGVLLEIGSKNKPVEWMQQVLDAKDRRAGAVTAPSDGLYLTRVAYPNLDS